jgi:hypothetical protein
MAKAQGKKATGGARKRLIKKVVARASRAKAAVRRVAKKAAPAPKKAATKPPKPAAREKTKAHKPAPAAHKHAKPAPHPPARPAPPAVAKKRTRRSRPRVQSSGPPSAAWFSQGEKPRPSSFIPAPPRAEAPSLVAAPPASSDRLVASHELTEFVVRTVPVRVDVEAGGGRVFIAANPEEVTLKAGEGIEWDFRYLGGADVIVDELVIEFEKPSPFPHWQFKSRRPGTARPHRQLSGAVNKNAAGKKIRYTIHAVSPYKTDLAVTRLSISVIA